MVMIDFSKLNTGCFGPIDTRVSFWDDSEKTTHEAVLPQWYDDEDFQEFKTSVEYPEVLVVYSRAQRAERLMEIDVLLQEKNETLENHHILLEKLISSRDYQKEGRRQLIENIRDNITQPIIDRLNNEKEFLGYVDRRDESDISLGEEKQYEIAILQEQIIDTEKSLEKQKEVWNVSGNLQNALENAGMGDYISYVVDLKEKAVTPNLLKLEVRLAEQQRALEGLLSTSGNFV